MKEPQIERNKNINGNTQVRLEKVIPHFSELFSNFILIGVLFKREDPYGGSSNQIGYSSLTYGTKKALYALCKSLMLVSFQEEVQKTTMEDTKLEVIKKCTPIIETEFKDYILAGIKLENPKTWGYYVNFRHKGLDRFDLGRAVLWAMEQISNNNYEDEDDKDKPEELLN